MKKAIVISGSIVAVLLVTAFVLVGIPNGRNRRDDNNAERQYENISFLRMADADEIASLSEKRGLALIRSDDNTHIGFDGLDVGDFACSLAYQTEGKGVQSVEGTLRPKVPVILGDTSEQAYGALMENINGISVLCEHLFGTPTIDKYNLYAKEGYPLELDDKESYISLLKGNANFGLYVRDTDGSYWKFFTFPMEGSTTEETIISFGFTRTFHVDSDLSADLVVK